MERGLKICLENCKYESGKIVIIMGVWLRCCSIYAVRRVARRFGLKEVGEDEDWNIYWTDTSVGLERVMEMKRYQVLNIESCSCHIEISFNPVRKLIIFLE